MKAGLTEIILLLDKSGSMQPQRNDVIGGLNTFIEKQKELPGEATFTLVQFDTTYRTTHENKPLEKLKKLTEKDYVPDGGTALIAAACETIDAVGKRLAKTDECNRPEKIIFAIMTDGEENASGAGYTKEKLAEKIKHQTEKYQWNFIFLGANMDAFANANAYNISSQMTRSYKCSAQLANKGTMDLYCMSASIRTGQAYAVSQTP